MNHKQTNKQKWWLMESKSCLRHPTWCKTRKLLSCPCRKWSIPTARLRSLPVLHSLRAHWSETDLAQTAQAAPGLSNSGLESVLNFNLKWHSTLADSAIEFIKDLKGHLNWYVEGGKGIEKSQVPSWSRHKVTGSFSSCLCWLNLQGLANCHSVTLSHTGKLFFLTWWKDGAWPGLGVVCSF